MTNLVRQALTKQSHFMLDSSFLRQYRSDRFNAFEIHRQATGITPALRFGKKP